MATANAQAKGIDGWLKLLGVSVVNGWVQLGKLLLDTQRLFAGSAPVKTRPGQVGSLFFGDGDLGSSWCHNANRARMMRAPVNPERFEADETWHRPNG